MYLTNSSEDTTSIEVFKRIEFDLFKFETSISLLNKPLTLKIFENSVIAGFSNYGGAYLFSQNLDSDTLKISEGKVFAQGFTIQDIRYNNDINKLALSASRDGVLIYDWDEKSEPTLIAYIATGYAYSAIVYEHNRVVVGTKNGIEIYEF